MTCEFCQKKLSNPAIRVGTTVCDECDSAMELQWETERTLKEEAWAMKYRCQHCNQGLTLDRRFDCIECTPRAYDQNVESEGENYVRG